MTPFYDLNQIASIEVEEEYHDHNTSVPYPTFFNTPQIIQGSNIITNHHFNHEVVLQQQQQQQLHHDQELKHHPMNQGSTNDTNYKIAEQRSSLIDQQKSGKWMSSKMRIIKKMMNPRDKITNKKPRRSKQLLSLQVREQQRQQESVQASSSISSINSNKCASNGIVRICSDCNTTKTPLWRSGPSGPKSLCNACGIRQRKARRALATAAAVNLGLIPSIMENKVKKLDIDRTIPFKKRCRFSTGSHKKICNSDDIVVRLSKSKAFHRVFPQDEKDAAILLMALSCGHMCS